MPEFKLAVELFLSQNPRVVLPYLRLQKADVAAHLVQLGGGFVEEIFFAGKVLKGSANLCNLSGYMRIPFRGQIQIIMNGTAGQRKYYNENDRGYEKGQYPPEDEKQREQKYEKREIDDHAFLVKHLPSGKMEIDSDYKNEEEAEYKRRLAEDVQEYALQ